MKKQNRISKILHWIVLLSFFLPFFYTGCGSKEELVSSAQSDSISSTEMLRDSVKPDSILTETLRTSNQNNFEEFDSSKVKESKIQSDSIVDEPELNPNDFAQIICDKFPFWQPFLIPDLETYTGVGLIIASIGAIIFLGVLFSFLLLIIGLSIKSIDTGARKSIVLIEVLALILLSIAHPYSLSSKTLWGFWVCLSLISLLTAYDFYLIKYSKGQKI